MQLHLKARVHGRFMLASFKKPDSGAEFWR